LYAYILTNLFLLFSKSGSLCIKLFLESLPVWFHRL